MNYEFNREWLIKKFGEIKRRTLMVIDQLDDAELNDSSDSISHNIPTLLRHIEGNINERIRKSICKEEVIRDRDQELSKTFMTKSEAEALVHINMDYVIDVIKHLPQEKFEETQIVRGKERLHIDMLHQCAAHYSEHMGQILYIAKQCLKENYKSTSV
ncbi:DUF1572 domain-containing protein [Paenibacillus sp. N1-5-1-14]|uniref:DUF1572 domain-containing protein n=1 Tax=Paenibacillus radicibacter TaxID=2972488 RepID=UPI00215951C5|nr:DUF1572 domain-containing protein [Paenibacillus radicibacter]MCR8642012.1 DUF1572 domain-containing protein [Paenibacillus radicibacter]